METQQGVHIPSHYQYLEGCYCPSCEADETFGTVDPDYDEDGFTKMVGEFICQSCSYTWSTV